MKRSLLVLCVVYFMVIHLVMHLMKYHSLFQDLFYKPKSIYAHIGYCTLISG